MVFGSGEEVLLLDGQRLPVFGHFQPLGLGLDSVLLPGIAFDHRGLIFDQGDLSGEGQSLLRSDLGLVNSAVGF